MRMCVSSFGCGVKRLVVRAAGDALGTQRSAASQPPQTPLRSNLFITLRLICFVERL